MSDRRSKGLCVSRKLDESITVITSDGIITITVIQASRSYARLRVSAPEEITILRSELMDEEAQDEI